jgi:phage pi2 protein 07
MSDGEAIKQFGTAALNVTGSYFSEYEINGKTHYEDWVVRELAERLQNRREFTVKTHKALFHARVGAGVRIQMRNEELGMRNGRMAGTINAFSFRYKRDKAFIATFRITEEMSNEE